MQNNRVKTSGVIPPRIKPAFLPPNRDFRRARRLPAILTVSLAFAWLLTSMLFSMSQAVSDRQEKGDSCVECHSSLDETITRLEKEDIHLQKGLGCTGCHGGDPGEQEPELAMDPRRGFVGRPKASQVASFCGKCHSDAAFMRGFNPALRIDQEAEYFTSQHGKRMAAGDEKAATCVSCHGNHGIRPATHRASPVHPQQVAATCGKCHADAAYMKGRLPVNQLSEYHASVHANALNQKNDLSAPTCNDCHGNHGAVPPGVSSIANVCGTCHTRQAELFRRSPHKAAFQENGFSECAACHDNHQVLSPAARMLGVEPDSSCTNCHSEEDAGYQTAKGMSQAIDSLAGRLHEAESLVQRAERAGMEVSRARLELAEGHDAFVNARVAVHAFSLSELREQTERGMTTAEKAYRLGDEALAELQFRRKGLAASLVVIVLALTALYLKLQQLERGESSGGEKT